MKKITEKEEKFPNQNFSWQLILFLKSFDAFISITILYKNFLTI